MTAPVDTRVGWLADIKAGDAVWVRRYGGYRGDYTRHTVAKVTPTGMIKVAGYTYNPDGSAQGRNTYAHIVPDDHAGLLAWREAKEADTLRQQIERAAKTAPLAALRAALAAITPPDVDTPPAP